MIHTYGHDKARAGNDKKREQTAEADPILTAEQRRSNLHWFIGSVVAGAIISLGVNYVVRRHRSNSINESHHQIESALEVQVRDVIRNSQPETFYEGPHGRAYLKIDGIAVEDYFKFE